MVKNYDVDVDVYLVSMMVTYIMVLRLLCLMCLCRIYYNYFTAQNKRNITDNWF